MCQEKSSRLSIVLTSNIHEVRVWISYSITRLRDRNGDGETDLYECFNNDTLNTEHFHEPCMDLQTDASGRFYYMKGGRHALRALHPHHGTLIRVTADGATSEIIGGGFVER